MLGQILALKWGRKWFLCTPGEKLNLFHHDLLDQSFDSWPQRHAVLLAFLVTTVLAVTC